MLFNLEILPPEKPAKTVIADRVEYFERMQQFVRVFVQYIL
jgi:hypothetical protein